MTRMNHDKVRNRTIEDNIRRAEAEFYRMLAENVICHNCGAWVHQRDAATLIRANASDTLVGEGGYVHREPCEPETRVHIMNLYVLSRTDDIRDEVAKIQKRKRIEFSTPMRD